MTIMIVYADRTCLPAIRTAMTPFKKAEMFLSKVERPGEGAPAVLAGGGFTPSWLRLDILTRPADAAAIAQAIEIATRQIGTVHIQGYDIARDANTQIDWRKAMEPVAHGA